jgi:hypothetical protein
VVPAKKPMESIAEEWVHKNRVPHDWALKSTREVKVRTDQATTFSGYSSYL